MYWMRRFNDSFQLALSYLLLFLQLRLMTTRCINKLISEINFKINFKKMLNSISRFPTGSTRKPRSTPSWPFWRANWRNWRTWRQHSSLESANTPIGRKLSRPWTRCSTLPNISWARLKTGIHKFVRLFVQIVHVLRLNLKQLQNIFSFLSTGIVDGYFTATELETLEKKLAEIKLWKEQAEKDQAAQPMHEMPKLTTRCVSI